MWGKRFTAVGGSEDNSGVNDVANQYHSQPVLTNPYLWALVFVSTGAGVVAFGLTSGVGIFLGGIIGIIALAVGARFLDEIRQPGYENKIDPWSDWGVRRSASTRRWWPTRVTVVVHDDEAGAFASRLGERLDDFFRGLVGTPAVEFVDGAASEAEPRDGFARTGRARPAAVVGVEAGADLRNVADAGRRGRTTDRRSTSRRRASRRPSRPHRRCRTLARTVRGPTGATRADLPMAGRRRPIVRACAPSRGRRRSRRRRPPPDLPLARRRARRAESRWRRRGRRPLRW